MDDSLILRAALRDAVSSISMPWDFVDAINAIAAINTLIDEAPAVDAVPVVRCGECRMRNNAGYCPDIEIFVGEHFFCAHGRRREANVAEHPWAASGCGQAFSPD